MLFIVQCASVEIRRSTEEENARNSAFNIQDFPNSTKLSKTGNQLRGKQTDLRPIDPAKNANISLLSTVLHSRPNETLRYLRWVRRNQIQCSAILFERVTHVTEGDEIKMQNLMVGRSGGGRVKSPGCRPRLSPAEYACRQHGAKSEHKS